jgi:hypothetical protein
VLSTGQPPITVLHSNACAPVEKLIASAKTVNLKFIESPKNDVKRIYIAKIFTKFVIKRIITRLV